MRNLNVGRPRTKRDEAGRPMIIPAFGPAIPIVPVSDFNQVVDRKQLEFFWSITGPSAMHNIYRGQPLWAVIACAYAEGLNHATKILSELHAKGELEQDPTKSYREVPVKASKRKS